MRLTVLQVKKYVYYVGHSTIQDSAIEDTVIIIYKTLICGLSTVYSINANIEGETEQTKINTIAKFNITFFSKTNTESH